ncbi:MAG: endo-1,4-beta-xylanase [Clostridia bacterium]|nr:endo-1,4-beta-xylanase [Clostridia bacterium]
MKAFFVCLLALSLGLSLVSAGAEASARGPKTYDPLLKELAAEAGFRIGICLSPHQLSDKNYLELLSTQFNTTTCTNETKAYSLLDQLASQRSEDGMPRMNYAQADQMISWAQANGVGVRGHVLTWDAYMTDWFFREDYASGKPIASREVILARMESYITQVITHFEEKFPGVIYCWDVVNEAMGDSPSECLDGDPRLLRVTRNGQPNAFYAYVGEDYVEYSFLFARNAVEALGADIHLFYNDYNMLYPMKRNAAKALVESINSFAMDENGHPRKLIDGIGMQGYMGGYGEQAGCLSPDLITNTRDSVRAFADLGMEVHITEMALRNYDEAFQAEHAAFYGSMFEMLGAINQQLGRNVLTCVTIWGVNDVTPNAWNTYTWKLNGTLGGILTEQGAIKPSFDAMYDALKRSAQR